MAGINKTLIIIGVLSIVVGIVSRLLVTPFVGLESRVFAGFSALCFLLSIALSNLKK